MIFELEVLEQLLSGDQPLARQIWFLDSNGVDGRHVLFRHWEDGNVEFVDSVGALLPDWKTAAVFKSTDDGSADVFVRLTEKRGQLV